MLSFAFVQIGTIINFRPSERNRGRRGGVRACENSVSGGPKTVRDRQRRPRCARPSHMYIYTSYTHLTRTPHTSHRQEDLLGHHACGLVRAPHMHSVHVRPAVWGALPCGMCASERGRRSPKASLPSLSWDGRLPAGKAPEAVSLQYGGTVFLPRVRSGGPPCASVGLLRIVAPIFFRAARKICVRPVRRGENLVSRAKTASAKIYY